MNKTPKEMADQLIAGGSGGLEDWRVHQFADDAAAHDDVQIARLYEEFTLEFERVLNELAEEYGVPAHVGQADDIRIPLSGIFRLAIWQIGSLQLYVTAAHEDRGLPILLMLGTA